MNKLKDKCAHLDLISTYCEEVLSKVKRNQCNAMQVFFIKFCCIFAQHLENLTGLESEWIFISVLAKTLDWPSDGLMFGR